MTNVMSTIRLSRRIFRFLFVFLVVVARPFSVLLVTAAITSMAHRMNWIYCARCVYFFSVIFFMKLPFRFKIFLTTNTTLSTICLYTSPNSIDFSKQFTRCKCAVLCCAMLCLQIWLHSLSLFVFCVCDISVATGCSRSTQRRIFNGSVFIVHYLVVHFLTYLYFDDEEKSAYTIRQ